MFAGSRIAERQVRELARARGWAADQVAAMPVPAEPLRRSVIVVSGTRYLFVPVTWTTGPEHGVEPTVVEKGGQSPAVEAALRAPFVRGVRAWLRFPSYEVLPLPAGGRRVIIPGRAFRDWQSSRFRRDCDCRSRRRPRAEAGTRISPN